MRPLSFIGGATPPGRSGKRRHNGLSIISVAPTPAPGSKRPLSTELGVSARTLSRNRGSIASGNALVPALARELAEVMKEATRTKEAVWEWWDVNVTTLNNAEVERQLLAQLMEELRSCLIMAKIFVRVYVND